MPVPQFPRLRAAGRTERVNGRNAQSRPGMGQPRVSPHPPGWEHRGPAGPAGRGRRAWGQSRGRPGGRPRARPPARGWTRAPRSRLPGHPSLRQDTRQGLGCKLPPNSRSCSRKILTPRRNNGTNKIKIKKLIILCVCNLIKAAVKFYCFSR